MINNNLTHISKKCCIIYKSNDLKAALRQNGVYMKKILALILASLLAVMVVSCSDNGGKVDTDLPQQSVTDNNTDISENPSDEVKPQNENKKIEAVTYDQFKEIIGYSMFPYDTTPDPEKNMLKICSGFNGDVELTYISFVLSKNAEKYFAEIVEKLDGEVVMTENSDEYNICKIKMGDVYYLISRVEDTVIHGSAKSGFEALETWFYGLGYISTLSK